MNPAARMVFAIVWARAWASALASAKTGTGTLVIALLLFASQVMGSEIRFDTVTSKNRAGTYLLDAEATLELNDTVKAGLSSGVALFFDAKVRINRHRRFWFDTTVFKAKRRYALVYYELTRHYRVTIVNEDEAKNFRSLLAALDYIGSIRDFPLMAEALVSGTDKYYGKIELLLDIGALPLPLRPQTFVSSAWRVESQEHSWPIN